MKAEPCPFCGAVPQLYTNHPYKCKMFMVEHDKDCFFSMLVDRPVATFMMGKRGSITLGAWNRRAKC